MVSIHPYTLNTITAAVSAEQPRQTRSLKSQNIRQPLKQNLVATRRSPEYPLRLPERLIIARPGWLVSVGDDAAVKHESLRELGYRFLSALAFFRGNHNWRSSYIYIDRILWGGRTLNPAQKGSSCYILFYIVFKG